MEHDEDRKLLMVVLRSLYQYPPDMWVDSFRVIIIAKRDLPAVTQEQKNAAVAAIGILSETP